MGYWAGGRGAVIRKEGKTTTGGYARAAFDQWTWEKGSSEEDSRAERIVLTGSARIWET